MSTAAVSPTALPTPTPAPQSVAGANPIFAQCMLRINNPKASHDFYTRLGMTLLTRFDFPKFEFSLFFYGYTSENTPSQELPQSERAKWLWSRPYPTVELTWNWPAETYEKSYELAQEGKTTEQYVNGNSSPQGFAHISLTVQDVAKAISALKREGVTSDTEATSVVAPSAAIVKDPETYYIQLAGPDGDSGSSASFSALDPVYSSVMLRVHDPREALPFFQRLGMQYLTRIDNESEKSTHYYLAYTNKTAPEENSSVEERQQWIAGLRECVLDLVHVWGSEEGESEYANGNVKPYRGFGHVGFIIDDIYSTTEAMEKHGYKVIRKPSPFADVGDIAFVEEPSTKYWVELITREGEAPSVPYEQPRLTS
ncbi:Glyoxalase/fosfomycin resistance/dioxygenase [Gracilaria domingensis]|nr:Glyoxalase/fosfomycin resistance/dioxygenase [Gracilaria domingensis]